jgi:hypothetical protein
MAKISKRELDQERKSSPVLDYMVRNNIPLTRAKFLSLAYMGNPPELLGPEEEAELPRFLQNWKIHHAD